MPDGMGGASLRELIILAWNYIWFMGLAMLGGTANYISRVRKKKLPFSFVELLGEWFIAGFAGLMTMFICLDQGFGLEMTAVFTGMSGHMGGRAIYIIENYISSKLPDRLI